MRRPCGISAARMSRYDALTARLKSLAEPHVVLTFDELDQMRGGLPDSAKKYAAWWANKASSQAHARAWLDAGRHAKPDFRTRRAVFTIASADAEASTEVAVQGSASPGDRAPRAPEEAAAKMDRLRQIGFTAVGWWELTDAGITFELKELAAARNILYAFVTGGGPA